MAKKDTATKHVRVLSDTTIDGTAYKPNQLVELPADQADSLEKQGHVDAHPDAVDYLARNGVQPIIHAGDTAAPAAE